MTFSSFGFLSRANNSGSASEDAVSQSVAISCANSKLPRASKSPISQDSSFKSLGVISIKPALKSLDVLNNFIKQSNMLVPIDQPHTCALSIFR